MISVILLRVWIRTKRRNPTEKHKGKGQCELQNFHSSINYDGSIETMERSCSVKWDLCSFLQRKVSLGAFLTGCIFFYLSNLSVPVKFVFPQWKKLLLLLQAKNKVHIKKHLYIKSFQWSLWGCKIEIYLSIVKRAKLCIT